MIQDSACHDHLAFAERVRRRHRGPPRTPSPLSTAAIGPSIDRAQRPVLFADRRRYSSDATLPAGDGGRLRCADITVANTHGAPGKRPASSRQGAVEPSYTVIVKTAISVPDAIFDQVEEAARSLGISRSEFYATAAQRWVDELRRRDVTAQIDAALGEGGDADEDTAELVAEAARRAFTRADGS